jgi:hypothetical protein
MIDIALDYDYGLVELLHRLLLERDTPRAALLPNHMTIDDL